MKPIENNEPGESVFSTATKISDSPTWFSSLVSQFRELSEARKHPQRPVEITAERDLAALDKLIENPSPLASLIAQIRNNIDERLHPKQKIQVSSAPVEVEEIWSKHDTGVPGLLSIGVHALAVTLLLIPWATSASKPKVTETAVMIYAPDTLILNLPQMNDKSGGGGGGGQRTVAPPSLGRLPRAADKQFAPPTVEQKNPDPTLIVEPTVVAPQLAQLPITHMLQIGDPEGLVGPPSGGPGIGGGIGSGQGNGVGVGKGPGVGPGEGGGYGGGVFRVGGGVSPPVIIHRVEPLYSEEARKARYQGTVVLEAIVRKDGTCDIIRVVRSLGFGLDENAMLALKQWRFRPGMRNGVAVDVSLNIEVNFNLR